MIKKALFELAGIALGEAFEKQKDPLTKAVKNVISDEIEGIISGKKTIDEWAEIAIKGVDKIKEQKVHEEDLRFVDGRLYFEISDKNSNRIIISFQLYFLDDAGEWKKTEGSSDVLTSNFTEEALEEMKTKGKVEFSVKG